MLNFAPLFLLETSTARCLKVVYCPSPMTINIMGLFKLILGGVKGGHTLQRWSGGPRRFPWQLLTHLFNRRANEVSNNPTAEAVRFRQV